MSRLLKKRTVREHMDQTGDVLVMGITGKQFVNENGEVSTLDLYLNNLRALFPELDHKVSSFDSDCSTDLR